jgi:uncharacterized repeat protein (TIGR01451 family)
VRAWATNSTGTAYGDEQTFTTSAQPPEPEEEEPLAPELQLEVVANEQAAFVGDLVEYGLTVRNTGDGEASEVKLFVPLPENTEFVGAYRGEDETARGAALPAELVAGTIEIVVGEVGPGQRAAVEVVLRAVKSGPVQLTASASSAQTPDAKLAEAPATAQVQDDYIEITRTPLPLCGPLGLMPLALMLCLVGWRRWRY